MNQREANRYARITIILILLLFIVTALVSSQTVQDLDTRLKRVEDSLGINNIIVPIDTNLIYPAYQGIILNSGSIDILTIPYSPMFRDADNLYKMFVQKGSQYYAVGSVNGLNNWIWGTLGNAPRGTIIKENPNRYLGAYHKWYNGQSYFYFAGSSNSYQWSDMALIRQPHGEDITFIIDNGTYKAYGRMNIPPAVRTIGYMTSPDFRNWSNLVEILKPDQADGYKEFYSMSVVKLNSGYYGFLNVFDLVTDLVSVQLVYSENGFNNWQRLNNRQDILQKKNGVQCLYASANLIGDKIYVNTISSKFNHAETNRSGQYYFIELYTILESDLVKFKQ